MLSDEARKARSRRNIALALALVAFVVLVFIVTIIKLSGGAVPHP
jgi:t-SNARE complex subunit (syntaxin)